MIELTIKMIQNPMSFHQLSNTGGGLYYCKVANTTSVTSEQIWWMPSEPGAKELGTSATGHFIQELEY